MSEQYIVKRQADVAAFFDVSIDTVKDWKAKGMPGDTGRYSLATILRWLRSEGPWRARPRLDDDPLLAADVDSPGLERYRLAKAELAELDAAERRKQVVSVERLRALFLRWGPQLRSLGERLQKRFGAEAGKMLNETLDQCEGVIGDELGPAESA